MILLTLTDCNFCATGFNSRGRDAQPERQMSIQQNMGINMARLHLCKLATEISVVSKNKSCPSVTVSSSGLGLSKVCDTVNWSHLPNSNVQLIQKNTF